MASKAKKATKQSTNNQNGQSPSSTDNASNERKKREKKATGADQKTDQQIRQELRLQQYVRSLSSIEIPADLAHAILVILLPFLDIVLQETIFTYLLGLLAALTSLTNKEVAKYAHCSEKRVRKGRKAVKSGVCPSVGRQRKKGAGRKPITKEAWLVDAIVKFVRLRAYGASTKSTQEYSAVTVASIQAFIEKRYHRKISAGTVWKILREQNIRLRTNKKLLYGNQFTETDQQRLTRHLQFDYIDSIMMDKVSDPSCIVLSIDCKKKQYLGNHAANGRSYTMPGEEVKAYDHDFLTPLDVASLHDADLDTLLDKSEGKAIPYGIYDIELNKGYMNIGISHDTPEFVAASIERFIDPIKKDHPDAKELYLLCDGGGSNASRCDLFKFFMFRLSNRIGMPITVVHYPPYRSKFNKIERQMFAFISIGFDRHYPVTLREMLNIVRATHTKKGLTIQAEVDVHIYETGLKLSEEQRKAINVQYVGPTAEMASKLSYRIDGNKAALKNIDFPAPITVFELGRNIDRSMKEKEEMKKQKALQKEQKAQQKEQKRQEKAQKQQKPQQKTTSGTSKKRGRKPGTKDQIPA